jgi:hypothetical protein
MGCRKDLTPQPPSLQGKGELDSGSPTRCGEGLGEGSFGLRNCGQGILLGKSPCWVVENGSCLDSFLYGNFR